MPNRKPLSLIVLIPIFMFLLPACSSTPAALDAVPAAAAVEPKDADPAPAAPTDPAAPVGAVGERTITLENLRRLTPQVLALPEYPERALLPAPGTPGMPPGATLLVQSGPNLYPVGLDLGGDGPITLGQPILLPLNGNTIAAFAPDASSLLVQEAGRLAVYRIDGSLVREIDVLDRTGWASYSPDGSALAITSQEAFETFVYAPDGSITKLVGFETAAPVYGAILGPEGKTLAWISRGSLQFHDVTAVQGGLGTRLDFTGFIGPAAFSPDGARLALDAEGELHLYRTADGELLAQRTLDAPVSTLAFSPAGDILAANHGEGFQTWNAETLEPLAALPGGGSDTLWVGFSREGDALLTLHAGTDEHELRVWVVR
jgi:WD40 repeat protein